MFSFTSARYATARQSKRRLQFCSSALVLALWFFPAYPQTTVTPVPATRETVEGRVFHSNSLERDMPYQVVLPAGYATRAQRYPVLYLLHGWHGDETNWIKLTHLTELAASYQLVIVTPRAENSWYVNSATKPTDRYADYILDDVIHDVDNHYRTVADAQHRAIAGLSMGGYGALLFALKRPDLFRFAASISGAFSGPSGIETVMPQLKPSIDQAYGGLGSDARRTNDLDPLIAAAGPAVTPYLFLECGSSDPLLPSNHRVVAELSAAGLRYEYHELPGAHTWTFWANSLAPMLAELARRLPLQPAISTPQSQSLR